MKKGKLIIFSAPSGAGKTTLVRHLLNSRSDLAFSISCCTRPKRDGEIDGEDYYFLDVYDFKQKVNNNEFAEWEEVYENQFYGTLKSEIQRIWNEGNHVLFDIDVKGGLNLKKQFGKDALAVFVKPPSVEELKKRLINRNTDSADKLKIRLAKANEELSYAPEFDEILVNDDLSKAKSYVEELISRFIN